MCNKGVFEFKGKKKCFSKGQMDIKEKIKLHFSHYIKDKLQIEYAFNFIF